LLVERTIALVHGIALLVLDVYSEKLLQNLRGTKVLHSVFHTLAYADVFDYPLTKPEVYRYLTSEEGTMEEVTRALSEDSLFTQTGEYFTLRGREGIVETRQRRAKIAARHWQKAIRYGQIIASLPFVKMVAITGSLAMNNTEEGKDIDYIHRLYDCHGTEPSLDVPRLITSNCPVCETGTRKTLSELSHHNKCPGIERTFPVCRA
jgi:hypothetical protein